MEIDGVIKRFEQLENTDNIDGMRRFGIGLKGRLYGINIPALRALAKEIQTNHELAVKLWAQDIHEAKILATLIADKNKITEELMEKWVLDLYSWDICDQLIMNYFEKSTFVWKKALEWSKREEEFVKRAGFVLMARSAMKSMKADDKEYLIFQESIRNASTDNRNMVKKAVNWAVRQIGKRNQALNKQMIELSKELLIINNKTANWIANDAIKELESEKVQERLKLKSRS